MPDFQRFLGHNQPWGSQEVIPYTEEQADDQVMLLGLPSRLPDETWQQWAVRKQQEQATGQQLEINTGDSQDGTE